MFVQVTSRLGKVSLCALLAFVMASANLYAESHPAVKITMRPDTPVAMRGMDFAAAFEIQFGQLGTIENIEIESPGWQLTAVDKTALSGSVASGPLRIPFQMTPGDPDQLLTIRFDFDGKHVSKSFSVGPKSVERQGRDYAATQVEPGRVEYEGRVAGGAIPLHFTGRIIYDRPVMLDSNNDPAGGTIPVGVDYIWVEVVDEDDLSTETIWSGYTDKNGYFDTGVIQWDDCDPVCDDPDIYLRWECDTPIVNVQDANDILEEDWSWSTADQTHDDFTGSEINFGTVKPADSGQMPILHIHNSITRAYRWIRDESGSGIQTNHVDVQWPEDEAGSGAYYIGFFDEIYIAPSRQWHEDTHTHEFGHHFLDEYAVNKGDDYCNNICDTDYDNDDCGHCQWCQETPLDAWNEGWPNWLADLVTRYYPSAYTFSDGTQYTPLKTRSGETVMTCQEDSQIHDPFRTEGFVAAVMRDIEDDDPDPQPVTVGDYQVIEREDCLAMGSDELFNIAIVDEPTTLDGFLMFFMLRYPDLMPRLYTTLRHISLDFESRFPADTQPPGVVEEVRTDTHPTLWGGPLPCIVLDWDTPPDDVTGANSYSIEWGTNPAGSAPDQTVEIIGACVSVTMDPEPIDDYYLSIRAKDYENNWSPNWDVFGPFTITDCNGNGIVDVCEVNCNPAGVYDFLTCSGLNSFCNSQADCGFDEDCNSNASPDSCDVASGKSSDCNENGVPDECENISHWDLVDGVWSNVDSWREKTQPVNGNHVCIGVWPAEITSTCNNGILQLETLACDENLVIATIGTPFAQLTLAEPSWVRGNLTLSNNSTILRANDRLDIEGLFSWTGSNVTSSAKLAGSGMTYAHGGMIIPNGVVHLDNHQLFLEGNSSVEGNGRIDYVGTSHITVRPGATLEFDSTQSGISAGFGSTFINQGTVIKSGPISVIGINATVQNSGLVHVQEGTLRLLRYSDNIGTFLSDPDALLEFVGGGHEFQTSSSIVAEKINFINGVGGVNNIRGTYNVSNTTTIKVNTTFTSEANIINYGLNFVVTSSVNFDAPIGHTIHFDNFTCGTAKFNTSDPIEIDHLKLTSHLTSTAPITVTDHFDWYGAGYVNGPGEITVNGTMTIHPGSSQRGLSHRVLNNAGVATVQGSIVLNHADSLLNNLPGAVYDIQVDGGGSIVSGGTINNDGLMVKSAGTGMSTLSTNMNNMGTLEVQTGVIQFYTHYAYYFLQTAGETKLNGGDISMFGPKPFRVEGGTLTGYGTVTGIIQIDGGTTAPGLPFGTLNVAGPYSQSATSIYEVEIDGLNAGQFDELAVTGTATLAGRLQVVAGPNYSPQVGDSFVILTAASRTGYFDSIVSGFPVGAIYSPTDVTLVVLDSWGDLDVDTDVDLHDVFLFQQCFSGDGNNVPSQCLPLINTDFDNDGDADLDDFTGQFVPAITGPK